MHQDNQNKFVSLERKEHSLILRKNYAYKLNMYKSRRKRVIIQETTIKNIRRGEYAFLDNQTIEGVVVPASVEAIGQRFL